jgi:hypothetical protein
VFSLQRINNGLSIDLVYITFIHSKAILFDCGSTITNKCINTYNRASRRRSSISKSHTQTLFPLESRKQAAKMSDSSSSTGYVQFELYRYTPNLAAAVIFFIAFLATTVYHLYQMVKAKSWYFTPLVIGGVCEYPSANFFPSLERQQANSCNLQKSKSLDTPHESSPIHTSHPFPSTASRRFSFFSVQRFLPPRYT